MWKKASGDSLRSVPIPEQIWKATCKEACAAGGEATSTSLIRAMARSRGSVRSHHSAFQIARQAPGPHRSDFGGSGTWFAVPHIRDGAGASARLGSRPQTPRGSYGISDSTFGSSARRGPRLQAVRRQVGTALVVAASDHEWSGFPAIGASSVQDKTDVFFTLMRPILGGYGTSTPPGGFLTPGPFFRGRLDAAHPGFLTRWTDRCLSSPDPQPNLSASVASS